MNEEYLGLPDELEAEQAQKFLGDPLKVVNNLLRETRDDSAELPEELDMTGARQLSSRLKLDTNIDPNNLPGELDISSARDLVRKLGTSSIGVGVPEVGRKSGKSSGLATSGFFGPLPKIPGSVITQGFGAPVNYERNGKHNGVDLAGPLGSPIPSVEDGVVVAVEDQGKKAFGKSIVIRNADGSHSRYSHLNDFRVKQGDKIKAGQIIGGMGNTGYVIPMGGGTGVHLDYRRTR